MGRLILTSHKEKANGTKQDWEAFVNGLLSYEIYTQPLLLRSPIRLIRTVCSLCNSYVDEC
jgi:hypothetical protein